MSTRLDLLEAEVMKLGRADRARLLERLIASLDLDPEIEAAWDREAGRREGDLTSGSASAVPGPGAVARLRARLVR